jgi:hypothetical protein
MMNVIYERSFVQDQDIKPDERFLVNFALKYIGGYSLTTNADFLGTQSASAFGP